MVNTSAGDVVRYSVRSPCRESPRQCARMRCSVGWGWHRRLYRLQARAAFPWREVVTITITAREALDRGIWDDLCELKGFCIWAVNEGLMESSDSISLTEDEAEQLGLLRARRPVNASRF
jgi:hypothetical protein